MYIKKTRFTAFDEISSVYENIKSHLHKYKIE